MGAHGRQKASRRQDGLDRGRIQAKPFDEVGDELLARLAKPGVSQAVKRTVVHPDPTRSRNKLQNAAAHFGRGFESPGGSVHDYRDLEQLLQNDAGGASVAMTGRGEETIGHFALHHRDRAPEQASVPLN